MTQPVVASKRMNIGFKAACLKIAEESWSALQGDAQGAGVEPLSNEGFLCIMVPVAASSERQDVPSQADLRPVYLLSTLDTSPIALPYNGSELFRSLVSKLKCVVEENWAVANRQLSQYRSQVLESSGQDPRLLAQLLYDAQVLERIADNHKSLVQDVAILATSLSSLQNDQWRLKIDQSQFTDFTDLTGLQGQIRELEEKSQSIIQLTRFTFLPPQCTYYV
ncbi:hypothetical protein PFICI_14331 [Pestalotiopsis fici W106-1]|uniref:Uncharacterized protein n=1 Tax=Pestalotiopsis fici (strain W106-1 / CGMCC3.15140) TaxID=1229662 RepID=W3WKK8_PESFW|nr:uncharacterized protein PFICI_14331 [Pestalotiopsis fici W106-1]ETS74465.1 hypothetical protein PFICI_14331 [Pestalotiopsis fici W106-1]